MPQILLASGTLFTRVICLLESDWVLIGQGRVEWIKQTQSLPFPRFWAFGCPVWLPTVPKLKCTVKTTIKCRNWQWSHKKRLIVIGECVWSGRWPGGAGARRQIAFKSEDLCRSRHVQTAHSACAVQMTRATYLPTVARAQYSRVNATQWTSRRSEQCRSTVLH